MTRRTTCAALAIGCFTVACASGAPSPATTQHGARTPSVEGVWVLKTYKGTGIQSSASGQLLLQGGYFSYVYTMNEAGPQHDGRAHAGRYRLEGNTLTFIVNWNLQYVDGKGTTDRSGSERKSTIVLTDKTLTITFDNNGAVQTLERASEVR